MKNLLKLLFVANCLIFTSFSYAEDMVLVKYEEVEDCKNPPVWICHKDNNGEIHCVVKQDKCN